MPAPMAINRLRINPRAITELLSVFEVLGRLKTLDCDVHFGASLGNGVESEVSCGVRRRVLHRGAGHRRQHDLRIREIGASRVDATPVTG